MCVGVGGGGERSPATNIVARAMTMKTRRKYGLVSRATCSSP